MAMSEQEAYDKLREYEARIERADGPEKLALIQEALDIIREEGLSVPAEDLMRMVDFTVGMVESFLTAIIMTAEEMQSTSVPVGFIVELRSAAAEHIRKSVFGAVDKLGVPMSFEVPDDLSGVGF